MAESSTREKAKNLAIAALLNRKKKSTTEDSISTPVNQTRTLDPKAVALNALKNRHDATHTESDVQCLGQVQNVQIIQNGNQSSCNPGLDEIQCLGQISPANPNQLADRHVKLNFMCCVSTLLRLPYSEPNGTSTTKLYVVYVFNGGTYWTFNGGPTEDFKRSLQESNNQVLFKFVQTDQRRKSYDEVHIKLLRDQKDVVVLHKPASAVTAVRYIFEQKDFYMQETALCRVCQYYKTVCGMSLLSEVVLLPGFGSLDIPCGIRDYNLLAELASKTPKPQAPPYPSSGVAATFTVNLTDANSSSSQITVMRNVQPNTSTNTSIASIRHPVPQNKLQNLEDIALLDKLQYPLLTKQDLDAITYCVTCKSRFSYMVEKVIHYAANVKCGQEFKAANKTAASFYTMIQIQVDEVCRPKPKNLVCDACSCRLNSAFQYCLHRDKHKTNQVFVCVGCTMVLVSPFAYYRHKCVVAFVALNKPITIKPRGHVTVESKFTMYCALPRRQVDALLKCPVCDKTHAYFAGLIGHWKASAGCFNSMVGQGQERVFLKHLLMGHHVFDQNIECDFCSEKLPNAVAYMLHQDHHVFPDPNATLSCKACLGQYTTPCKFYRHQCKSNNGQCEVWCPFCDKLKNSTQKPDDNDDDLQIVSVQSLAPIMLSINNSKELVEEAALGSDIMLNINNSKEVVEEAALSSDETESPISSLETIASSISTPSSQEVKVEEQGSSSGGDDVVLPGNFDTDFVQNRGYCDDEKKKQQSLPDEDSDCYVCIDCSPCKLVRDSDGSLAAHCKESQSHYRINPLWVYSQFSLTLADVAKSARYGAVVQDLMRENRWRAKKRKTGPKCVQENLVKRAR